MEPTGKKLTKLHVPPLFFETMKKKKEPTNSPTFFIFSHCLKFFAKKFQYRVRFAKRNKIFIASYERKKKPA